MERVGNLTNIKTKYRKIDQEGLIRILDKDYNGIAVSIGKITFDNTSEENKTATMQYDYEVVDLPKDIKLEEGDQKFHNLLGDIIVDIIESTLEENPDLLQFEEKDED